MLFFGNARADKGLDRLIEATPHLFAQRPDAFVYVSTTTWNSEPADRRAIEERLAQFAEEPGVHVRIERIASRELEPTFKACNVVALPYHSVSQSGVLAVARAFQRPAVATDVFRGAARFAPGEGRICPAADPRTFAEGLVAQLADPTTPPPPDETAWDRNAATLRHVCEAVLA